MILLTTLDEAFRGLAPLFPGDRVLVGFSGGADSTALLWGAVQVGREIGFDVHAFHLDHGLDPASQQRARHAADLSRQICAPFVSRRVPVRRQTLPGESVEQAARRIRYDHLEKERQRLGARYTLTAHHADDQIETLLLRLLFGSGIEGLAGIMARRGRVIRPLLDLSRIELRKTVAAAGLEPVVDESNRDLRVPRNRVRHVLLPRLVQEHPDLGQDLLKLAATVRRSRRAIERRLRASLAPSQKEDSIFVRRGDLLRLPLPLWPFALALLHRMVGATYPPSRAARHDLYRQCRDSEKIGCDCGDGWRWAGHGEQLRLSRAAPSIPAFAYTFQVPGEHVIPELALTFRLRRGAVAPWMFEGSPSRTGLALSLDPGELVTVRNRRPGDKIQPLGCGYSRRLKEVLIDRHVPRHERDRLPLLVVGNRLAWVPGVTIHDAFQVDRDGPTWIAEIEQL